MPAHPHLLWRGVARRLRLRRKQSESDPEEVAAPSGGGWPRLQRPRAPCGCAVRLACGVSRSRFSWKRLLSFGRPFLRRSCLRRPKPCAGRVSGVCPISFPARRVAQSKGIARLPAINQTGRKTTSPQKPKLQTCALKPTYILKLGPILLRSSSARLRLISSSK